MCSIDWNITFKKDLINSRYYYYHTDNGVLLCGNCLEIMKSFPLGVFDAIITDPPYGKIKDLPLDGYKNVDTSWDKELPIADLNILFNKILRENGVIILFSQEPYTSKLIMNADKNLPFSYKLIWIKDHFANALVSKKAPVNLYEEICIFYKKYDIYNQNPLRSYFKSVLSFIGKSLKEINEYLGHRRAEHSFYITSTQFKLCSKQTYNELIRVFKINKMIGFKPYEDLQEINQKYSRVFNLCDEKYKVNVLYFKKDYNKQHPTQKPLALMEYLVKTYTKQGDLVLDFTCGSGTTLVACEKLNRRWIGIEINEKYCEIAKERLERLKCVA